MKRREFMSLSLGTAAATAVPLSMSSAPMAAVPEGRYLWAVAVAKAQSRVSASALQTQLKVTAAEANALITRMVGQGVVSVPDALGVARCTRPVVLDPSQLSVRSGPKAAARSGGVSTKRIKSDPKDDPASDRLKDEGPSPDAPIIPSDDAPEPQAVSDEAHSAE